MLHFLKNILQLIVNPGRGWEDISHDGEKPSDICARGFYPLLAVAALSCVGGFWKMDSDATLVSVIQEAIITFAAYFATMFLAESIFNLTMAKICDKEPSAVKSSTVIIYSLAIMALINILINLMPLDFAVLHFLPIYVGFILYKAMRYLSVDSEKTGHYMFVAVFSIILPPYALTFIFNLIKP